MRDQVLSAQREIFYYETALDALHKKWLVPWAMQRGSFAISVQKLILTQGSLLAVYRILP